MNKLSTNRGLNLKTSENQIFFQTFSEGMEMKHWREMDKFCRQSLSKINCHVLRIPETR